MLGQFFRQRAVMVVRNLQQDADFEIIPQADEQFEEALRLYSQRQDKQWSL